MLGNAENEEFFVEEFPLPAEKFYEKFGAHSRT